MSWIENWPELAAIGFVLIGALLAVSSSGPFMTLLIALAFGAIMARFTTIWPDEQLKMHLLTIASLAGILLGTDWSILAHTIVSYFIGYALGAWATRQSGH